MDKSIQVSVGINGQAVLTSSKTEENLSVSPSAIQSQTGSSHTLNNCSVPKSKENTTENIGNEKDIDKSNDERRQKCMKDLETLAGSALKQAYPREYKTWSNSKNRSKKLKGIKGPHWGVELDTYPGFLKQTGPKRFPEDSLDRIDPSYGYVVGNIRWASKQLQSENRKNVEIILVRGVPMTLPQFADLLGITYDALRMRIFRGDTIENILAQFLRADKPIAKSKAAKIEACPWPKAKEEGWENTFKAERHKLLPPHEQDSRTAFFVAKTKQMLGYHRDQGRALSDWHGPEYRMSDDWIKKYEYWSNLLKTALELREIVLKELTPKFSLEPSEEELALIEAFSGAPSTLTDEDMVQHFY